MGSFIDLAPLQSLDDAVPHIVDAGDRVCERTRTDDRVTRRKLNYYCCLFFVGIFTHLPLRMAICEDTIPVETITPP